MRKIKVCGLINPLNIRQVTSLRIEMAGFIFYPDSRRYVGENFQKATMDLVPVYISKVGVFVDEDPDTVLSKVSEYELDYVQLHGSETADECEFLFSAGVKIIKAFSVDEDFDFSQTTEYENNCELFLFDTKTINHGGSGIKFDWNLLSNYKGKKQYILSGGIGMEDAEQIKNLKLDLCWGFDLNSKFETEPGIKDAIMLDTFISEIHV